MLEYKRHVGIHRALFNDEMPVTTESFAYVPGAIAGSRCDASSISTCALPLVRLAGYRVVAVAVLAATVSP
eukprot:9435-Heterococcus_DN1.PRE.1